MFKYFFNTKVDKALELYNSGKECITFDFLSELPVGEVIEIKPDDKGAVTTVRLKNRERGDKNLIFKVFTRKGEQWKYHYHDCNESIVVHKGYISEEITGKIVKRGDMIFIPSFKEHHIIAHEDTVFYVEFQNPYK